MATENPPHREKSVSDANNLVARIDELPVIEIGDDRYHAATHIAKLRTVSYRSISGGRTHGEQTPEEAHMTGVLGEIAAAYFVNGTSLFDIDALHQYGDSGWDLSIPAGTIDVKTTATEMDVPDLLVPADTELNADYYLLAHRIGDRRVRLFGVASRDCVEDHPVRRFPGSRLNYVVPAEDLDLFKPP